MNTEEKFVCRLLSWRISGFLSRFLLEDYQNSKSTVESYITFHLDLNLMIAEPKFANFLKKIVFLHHALCTGLKMKSEIMIHFQSRFADFSLISIVKKTLVNFFHSV